MFWKTIEFPYLIDCTDDHVLAELNISFSLADAVQYALHQPIVKWHFLGGNCDECGGKNNNSSLTTQESSIHKQIFPTHKPPPLIHHHAGDTVYLNDNTLCCAITQLSILSFFYKAQWLGSGTALTSNTVWCQHNHGKGKENDCYGFTHPIYTPVF